MEKVENNLSDRLNEKIAIVLVVFNEMHNLELLYDSLTRQSYSNFKIYFVDNNSEDDSIDLSKRLNKKYNFDIDYILLKDNVGFAEGNNIGAEHAIRDGCEYVFILNNDIELDKYCVQELVNLLSSDESIGIAAPILFFWQKNKTANIIQEFGGYIDYKKFKTNKLFLNECYEDIGNNIPEYQEVDFFPGGCFMIKSILIQKVGLFEERFFIYGDEKVLSKKVKSVWYKIFVTKRAKAWHNHKVLKGDRFKIFFEYYLMQRNKYLFFKFFDMKKELIRNLFFEILLLPRSIRSLIRQGGKYLLWFYFLGIIDGLQGKHGKPSINFKIR